MNNKNNFNYLFLSVLIFSVSIIYFFSILYINYSKENGILFWKSLDESAFLLSFFFLITFPGFILHYRFTVKNKNRKIIFKQKHLEIIEENKISTVLYTDVIEVENHSVAWKGRNPWSDYKYVKITLKNGDKMHYNCLTNVINSENNMLKSNRIKKYKIDDIYPWY